MNGCCGCGCTSCCCPPRYETCPTCCGSGTLCGNGWYPFVYRTCWNCGGSGVIAIRMWRPVRPTPPVWFGGDAQGDARRARAGV